jgi:hypothetical protein
MNKNASLSCFAVFLMLLTATSIVAADNKQQQSTHPVVADSSGSLTKQFAQSPLANERLKWQVIAAGGNRGTSTNFILSGTAGQTAVGKGTSTNFQINRGFWQSFVASCDDCGDANSDGSIDISDVVFLIAYIFSGGAAPGDCRYPNGKGDANGDVMVDISDVVYLISYIFSGGSTPHCQ